MTALPVEVTYGKVVGQFLLDVQDGVDADSLPDALPAQGTIRFEPLQPNQRLLQPTPATLASRLKTCSLDGEGFLVDAQGNRGIWLVTGRYQVVFRLKGARILPREILVTENHTEMYPLDLAYAIPPEGSELTMSQYAELSDRVAKAESGAGQDLSLAARLADPGSATYAAFSVLVGAATIEQIAAEQVATELDEKADKTSTYTKTEVNTMVGSVTPPNVAVMPGASDATVFPAGVDVIFT